MITRMQRRMRSGARDSGVTLIELLIYMILLGIVIGIIASVLITAMQKQREVVRISQTTSDGQLVTSAVDLAMLNAVDFRVVSNGDSTVLVTKTRSTAEGPGEENLARCVGFYYDATTRKLHTASDMIGSGGLLRTKALVPGASLSSASGWPVLAEGVRLKPGGGSAIFTKNAADSTKVDTYFLINTLPDKAPVTFQLTSGMRGTGLIDNKGTC